jgi:hypothetical protein
MYIITRKAIAQEYSVCRKTLRKWMDELPYESPHLLTLSWQKLIYEELGYPPGVDSEDFDKVQIPRKYRKKEG